MKLILVFEITQWSFMNIGGQRGSLFVIEFIWGVLYMY